MHFGFQVAHEHPYDLVEERHFIDVPVVLLIEHLVESVAQYSRQVAILHKRYFVKNLLVFGFGMQRTETQVAEQVAQVGFDELLDELGVVLIEIFDLDLLRTVLATGSAKIGIDTWRPLYLQVGS